MDNDGLDLAALDFEDDLDFDELEADGDEELELLAARVRAARLSGA